MPAQQVAQMAAEGKLKPSQSEQVDMFLKSQKKWHEGEADVLAEISYLQNYINLLRRQAIKAKNQRKTLRDLHKVYRATMMENRWLHEMALRELGKPRFAYVVKQTKYTLWSMFRSLRPGTKPKER